MPRPRVDDDKKLSEMVHVLFSKAEREAIEQARKGRPVSEWIRETILPFLRAWLK